MDFKFTGWLVDYPDFRDYNPVSEKVNSLFRQVGYFDDKPLPSVVDLRQWCSPIEDQGKIGSCTAQAAASLIEYYERKAFGRHIDVSRLFLYKVSRNLLNWIGDTGAFLRIAMASLRLYGAPPETYWPYNVEKFDDEPPAFVYALAQNYKATKYVKLDPSDISREKLLNSIKKSLAAGLPSMFGFVTYDSLVQSRYTGMIPFPGKTEQGKGGHAVCLSGDTLIPLADGSTKTIKELSETKKEESFWVYSCKNTGEIVPGLAKFPRQTDSNRKILKITLDNGKIIKCTPDHLIMKRDGTFCESRLLNVGDSLMPLYRDIDNLGYETIFNNKTKVWNKTHRKFAPRIKEGYVIHHKDMNKRNNNPDNLRMMTWEAHTKLHYKNTDALRKYSKSERGRNNSREVMKKNWNDPEWREKMLKIQKENGKKVSKKLLEAGKLGFQTMDKEILLEMQRKNGKKTAQKYFNTEESKEKTRKIIKEKFLNDSEYRKHKIEIAKKNIKKFNDDYAKGNVELSDKQKNARKNNALKLNSNEKIIKKRSLKTIYTRYYKNKYDSFDDYLNAIGKYEDYYNHKIVAIEDGGYSDVYDITVFPSHNFAIDAGIFVHNCAVGFDDNRVIRNDFTKEETRGALIIRNSWSPKWGDKGYGYLPYEYVMKGLAVDWWTLISAEWVDTGEFGL